MSWAVVLLGVLVVVAALVGWTWKVVARQSASADGNARAIATSKRRLRIPPGSDRMAFGFETPAPLAAILEEEAAKQRALDDGGAESGG